MNNSSKLNIKIKKEKTKRKNKFSFPYRIGISEFTRLQGFLILESIQEHKVLDDLGSYRKTSMPRSDISDVGLAVAY